MSQRQLILKFTGTSFNGRTAVLQAANVGSIPTVSTNCGGSSVGERLLAKQEVAGSFPVPRSTSAVGSGERVRLIRARERADCVERVGSYPTAATKFLNAGRPRVEPAS